MGPAATSEFVAFLRLFRQLPSIDDILLNPDTAPLPTETSAQIAIATALGRAMTDNSLERALRYLERMPTEMRVMAVRDREAATAPKEAEAPTVDNIFAHMSAYMEAPESL